MKIIRDGKEYELTGPEMCQAFREMRDADFIDDIGNRLRDDYDIEPCADDSIIDLAEIATDAQDLLANDDTYWMCYTEAIEQAIKQYLEDKEIEI